MESENGYYILCTAILGNLGGLFLKLQDTIKKKLFVAFPWVETSTGP